MNYILRYTGDAQPDETKVRQVLQENNVQVLDASGLPKMVLLGGDIHEKLSDIKEQLPGGWEFFPQKEQAFKVPDTRRKIGE